LRDFEVAYGLKYCCLRYFNAAGGDLEGEIKNYQMHTSNLIPRILLSLKKRESTITIYGTDYPTTDGTCIRDYIHLEDLGVAHITAMEELFNGKPSAHYNLGNGKGFSVREVIQATEEILKLKIKVVEGARRLGDPTILLADSTKAFRQLNWQPRFSLQEMIVHAWNAYIIEK
jgi:UDP-glucose 4-epimerase